jgi:hypothetical protein
MSRARSRQRETANDLSFDLNARNRAPVATAIGIARVSALFSRKHVPFNQLPARRDIVRVHKKHRQFFIICIKSKRTNPLSFVITIIKLGTAVERNSISAF